jgi:4-amino-4-deoxy-L-arabinose transferase-like glycosyltransferase
LGFKGDENFYLESTQEMLETGDLITPRYMGRERFEKPILFYWIILSSFKVFGVSWFTARLPSILFGGFSALLIFAIANLLFKDKRIGLFAALFSATTGLFYRYARLAVPDMSLIFFITLALYYFVRLYKDRQESKAALLFFVAIALAFLVKGPVGSIIPLLIAVIFCVIKRERPIGLGTLSIGIAVFVLMIVPWFYFIYKIHGGAYISHIWNREILQRLGSGYNSAFITKYFKGLFFYVCAFIYSFIPYSFFVPVGFINSFSLLSKRFSSNRHRGSENDAHLFLVLWIAVIFFFFTFVAEKRAWYLLPLSPPVSILTGAVFARAISEKEFFSKPPFKIPYLITFITIILFTVLLLISYFVSGENKITPWIFMLIIIPVVLSSGIYFRNSVFLPLSLVLSLALLNSTIAVFPPFDMSRNKMERAAAAIKLQLKEGDIIGIGSHGIIPEELQVYFETPVKNIKVRYRDNGTPNLETAPNLLRFLDSDGRIFCVIKRKDYDSFIPEEIKETLYILNGYYVWKRRIRFDKELKEAFINFSPNSFRDTFQNEIYVVSNRE